MAQAQPTEVTAKISSGPPPLPEGYSDPTPEDLIRLYAGKYGVDPNLALAVSKAESNGNPNAVNRNANGTTDYGAMQTNSATAASPGYGVPAFNPQDMNQNAEGGVRYLKAMMDQFPGDQDRAIAAYHLGAGAVGKGQLTPDARDYVGRVRQHMGASGGYDRTLPGGVGVDQNEQLFDQLSHASEQMRQAEAAKTQEKPGTVRTGGEQVPIGDTGVVAGFKRSAIGQALEGGRQFANFAATNSPTETAKLGGEAVVKGISDMVQGLISGRIREGKDAYARTMAYLGGGTNSDAALALTHAISMVLPGAGDILGPMAERAHAGDVSGALTQGGLDAGLMYGTGRALSAARAAGKASGGPPAPATAKGGPSAPPPAPTSSAAPPSSPAAPPSAAPGGVPDWLNSQATSAGMPVPPKGGPPAPAAAPAPKPGLVRTKTVPDVMEHVPRTIGIQEDLSRNPEMRYGADVEAPLGTDARWQKFIQDERGFIDPMKAAELIMGLAGAIGLVQKGPGAAAALGRMGARATTAGAPILASEGKAAEETGPMPTKAKITPPPAPGR